MNAVLIFLAGFFFGCSATSFLVGKWAEKQSQQTMEAFKRILDTQGELEEEIRRRGL